MNKRSIFLSFAGPKEVDDDFSRVIGEVTPLSPHGRYLHPTPPPSSLPLSRLRDEREVILESMADPIHSHEDVEMDGDAAFARPGLSRQSLRRLRRGEWLIQAELDLHGLTKVEAKIELAEFLHECKHQWLRCVRIIHGKGLRSPNKEPVLKLHVRHWLTQRDEVLAFVTARPVDGGGGATVVLLKGR
ncbi:MAG: DNA mismatch repair protein MutS [Hydrogenophilales bacterium CG03_land_8_20_14_0_80_62_28]|nr:MAG: DNA mismatch repair protein MutS [Hydrogenophilales bacterium CG03_land_8_20_14_0_80_62_28]